MASKLSMSEMLSIYKGKDKPAAALTSTTVLPGRNVLEKLEKLCSTRLGSLAPVIAKHSSSKEHSSAEHSQQAIAICLVIVDELHHEDIWRRWIEDNDEVDDEEEGHARKRQHIGRGSYAPSPPSSSSSFTSSFPSSSSTSGSNNNTSSNTDNDSSKFRYDKDPSTSDCNSNNNNSGKNNNDSNNDNDNNANNAKKCSARLFIHAKYPDRIKSQWVRERTLDHSHLPEWNSPDVVRAMLSVLTEAVSHSDCERFIFGTETCLPIYGLQETCRILFKNDTSWMNARHKGESLWETSACFNTVNPLMIPQKAVWKAIPGWIMLNRRHAEEILLLPKCLGADIDLVDAWGKERGTWVEGSGSVYAPEEVYFPTMLAILGYLRDESASKTGATVQVEMKMVTHARWARRGEPNPTNLTLSHRLVEEIRATGAVFARKFSPGSVTYRHWADCVAVKERSAEHSKGHSQGHSQEHSKEHAKEHSRNHFNKNAGHTSSDGSSSHREYSNGREHSNGQEHSYRNAQHSNRSFRQEYSNSPKEHSYSNNSSEYSIRSAGLDNDRYAGRSDSRDHNKGSDSRGHNGRY